MDDTLASRLIDLYCEGLEEHKFKVLKLENSASKTKLVIKVGKKEQEYTASVGSGTVLDSQVAVLRDAYWEHVGPLREKAKKKKKPMKKKLTYKDIYKQ